MKFTRTVFAGLLLLALGACGGGGATEPQAGVPPDLGPLTYVAMGASDAVGVGASPQTRGYVYQINERLMGAGADTTFHNFGISGGLVGDLLDPQLGQALAAEPDIVTIWTGANDLIGGADPSVFADDLDELLGQLRAGTSATIVIGNLVDLTVVRAFRLFPNANVTVARVDAFNERIVAAAQAHGAVIVKLSQLTLTDDLLWIDGFHPNNAGYTAMADAFWAEIKVRLPEPVSTP